MLLGHLVSEPVVGFRLRYWRFQYPGRWIDSPLAGKKENPCWFWFQVGTEIGENIPYWNGINGLSLKVRSRTIFQGVFRYSSETMSVAETIFFCPLGSKWRWYRIFCRWIVWERSRPWSQSWCFVVVNVPFWNVIIWIAFRCGTKQWSIFLFCARSTVSATASVVLNLPLETR